MKLVHKNSDSPLNERLEITRKEIPCLDSSWHYHSEYELLYISQSHGIRFVGDSVSQFSPGDLVLVGPYLPHLWRNDPSFYKDDSIKVKTIILKFTKNFIGEDTFNLTEFKGVNNLLEESKFGVSFGGKVSSEFHDDLMGIIDLPMAEQTIKLLDILYRLSLIDNREILSSADMRQYTSDNSQRLDDVIKYISINYNNYISLEDVSDIACMTTNSFCRFFKNMTNKSFTEFLNEVRIRNASRLLAQEDTPVSEICYEVGYNSVTNFNRQFKKITGCTPKDYRMSI